MGRRRARGSEVADSASAAHETQCALRYQLCVRLRRGMADEAVRRVGRKSREDEAWRLIASTVVANVVLFPPLQCTVPRHRGHRNSVVGSQTCGKASRRPVCREVVVVEGG